MADNETITGIIAEMHDLGKLDEKSTDKIPRTLLGLGLRTYADRLKAAQKRERAKIEADALDVGGIVEAARKRELGDAAKLREALEELVANIEMRSSTFGLNVMVDTKTYLGAKAALAVPPRNCERFQTVKQAKEAYSAEVRRIYIWDGCETERLVDWLLAPAMEQKGDNDGNE